ncbi:MAG: SMC-Scp complex subunit ScpB [Actinobacteria bacterium]|nr:SMC-Scp complex subunit ScpB [Actinomycetota bacterium]
MNEHRRAIEAIVMVADEPADPRMLAQLIEVAPAKVDELCAQLAAEYDAEGRGFQLIKVAGGWRFQSREELAPYVERFVLTGQSARLSAAALETLAIVAFKQPISRAQVAAIRGVSVDGVMRTLHQRGYIAELARDPGPGQAILFGTTSLFLERLGLNSLDELPPLGDFVPSAEVVEALEQGLRVQDDPEPAKPAVDPDAPKWYDAPTDVDVDVEAAAEAAADADVEVEAAADEPPLALDALDVLADTPPQEIE